MRIFGWLLVGLFSCHESFVLLGAHQSFNESLFEIIFNPLLFLKASLILLVGLLLSAYSVKSGWVFIHEFCDQHPQQRIVYGMIYSATLLSGWGWLVMTALYEGGITIILTLILALSWEKRLGVGS